MLKTPGKKRAQSFESHAAEDLRQSLSLILYQKRERETRILFSHFFQLEDTFKKRQQKRSEAQLNVLFAWIFCQPTKKKKMTNDEFDYG